MGVERHTGTITMLFCDLVGSTEAMQQAGEDEGRQLLGRYLTHLREVARAHAGQEVKNLGDGMEVAFSSVVAALETATTMQRAVHWENRSADFPLGLRVGMNVCEASVADGDYWGLSVVVAKRLCDGAGPRQILVSGLVRELVSNREEWRFHSLGERSLKGISEPVETFELLWKPLDHAPTLPLPSSSTTPEQQLLARFIRSVRRPERSND